MSGRVPGWGWEPAHARARGGRGTPRPGGVGGCPGGKTRPGPASASKGGSFPPALPPSLSPLPRHRGPLFPPPASPPDARQPTSHPTPDWALAFSWHAAPGEGVFLDRFHLGKRAPLPPPPRRPDASPSPHPPPTRATLNVAGRAGGGGGREDEREDGGGTPPRLFLPGPVSSEPAAPALTHPLSLSSSQSPLDVVR